MFKQPAFQPDSTLQLKRILIVDGDPKTLHYIGDILDRAGFQVVRAASAVNALNTVQRHGVPHLVLVDFARLGMDGFDFCRRIQAQAAVPIIVLTAAHTEETVVRILEGGADDCIIKPFSPKILVARVQRVLRRVVDFDYTRDLPVQVDERLSLDLPARVAIVDGEPVALTPTETELLRVLVRSAGRFVPLDSLLRQLWPLERAEENRLHVHVSRLRRKIETPSSHNDYIVSKWGRGYSLQLATVAVADRADLGRRNLRLNPSYG